MDQVWTFLQQRARGELLSWAAQTEAAERFEISPAAVEQLALENGLLPARYRRNRAMISCAEQLQLFKSRVAVVGCGGLGGYVLEELARLGVGRLVAVDPDVFEEHNLNRQLLSSPQALGTAKVAAAAGRLGQINPAVAVTVCQEAFGSDNGARLLQGVQVAVDGLDNLPARRALAACCSAQGTALVHGAIAGWYGQVATQLPGERTLEKLLGAPASDRGVEQELGNPSFTPAVLASLQVAEVCKVLLGRGELLRDRALVLDLLAMEFTEIPL